MAHNYFANGDTNRRMEEGEGKKTKKERRKHTHRQKCQLVSVTAMDSKPKSVKECDKREERE